VRHRVRVDRQYGLRLHFYPRHLKCVNI
jgi:hypothetical protein